ncbi:MAG TPA: hypothetical protein VIM69_10590 [Opitutaceae bacterium]
MATFTVNRTIPAKDMALAFPSRAWYGLSRKDRKAMDLEVRTTGRAPAVIELELAGEIREEDLRALALPRQSSAPPLKRLRDRHHRLAQLLASGETERDAAIICGYDLSRVSILKNDPAFKELLEFYRSKQMEKFDGFGNKLATIANEAADLLIEKLEDEDEAEKLTVPQLMALAELGADRIGYGKQTNSTSLNVNVGLADSLSEARKRVAERRAKVIDARPAD